MLRGLDWVDGLHPSPVARGQSEGGRLAGVVLTQEEGQVEAGVRGCGVSRRGVAWPRPLSLRRQDRAAAGYLASRGCRPIPASCWYFSSFLALIFFLNKNNYEGSKTPFFLDIPALRSQQRVGGKECPLSPRPLAFI